MTVCATSLRLYTCVVAVLCVHVHTERTHTPEYVDCLVRFSFNFLPSWQIYAHTTHVVRASIAWLVYLIIIGVSTQHNRLARRQSCGNLVIPDHPQRAVSHICVIDKCLVLDSSGHQETASRAKRHSFASSVLAATRADGLLARL